MQLFSTPFTLFINVVTSPLLAERYYTIQYSIASGGTGLCQSLFIFEKVKTNPVPFVIMTLKSLILHDCVHVYVGRGATLFHLASFEINNAFWKKDIYLCGTSGLGKLFSTSFIILIHVRTFPTHSSLSLHARTRRAQKG